LTRILNYKMNTNLNTFLAAYTVELEASNKRFNDLLFRRALNTKIDLTCIDRIKQGIQDDHPRFDSLMFRRALNTKIDLSCVDRIMQGIEDDRPRFDKLCEIIGKRKQNKDDKLCCIRRDDLEPITEFRIYDTTNDYEYEYLYIQPEDPVKMKNYYDEPEFYDYLLDAEHDPDALIALGYEPVLGMAKVFTKADLKHADGTFYRTSSKGGIFASEQCFTYYCDGCTIWLTQLDDKYWDRLTFDYNNRLYIKISDQRKHDWDLLKEVHDKVAKLQKELATMRKQQT
jgi:hypothetical protein